MEYIRAFSRRYSAQYCEQALLSLPQCPSSIIVPDGKNEVYYFEKKEYVALIDEIVEKHTSSKEKFNQFCENFHTTGKKHVSFCNEINNLNIAKLPLNEIKKIYLEYQQMSLKYAYFVWVGHLLATYWRDKGKTLVNDERELNPVKKNTLFLMQEKAVKLKEPQIEEFWKEYAWLPCLDLWNEPWTKEQAKQFVKEAVPINANTNVVSKEETIQMIQELGYIMDARDDYRRKAIFLIQPFFREIASRNKLTLKEVAFLTTEEIISLLDEKKINFSRNRENGFLLFLDNGKIKLIEDNFEKILTGKGFIEEKKQEIVTGIVACKGRVIGTAKIVKTIHDILKIAKGDVLITPMTHPDYIIAMKKAAAFVTDEGGLLSHAAIVARELQTPCIVGTKNATKVFENGQRIEVDADKGTVKVVK